MKEIMIEVSSSGERIDTYISKARTDFSRSYIQKLIDNGDVLVNQTIVKSNYKVKIEDEIVLKVAAPVSMDALPENLFIEVLFEDENIIVVNKPKGMVVHPAAGNLSGTLVNALLNHCEGRLSNINGVIRPGIVHRIDKDTSGVLLVTKTNFAHEYFSEKFKNHDITRTYFAIVEGVITENKGKIDAPISRNINDRKKMSVNVTHGKHAITHFEVIERFKDYTLIKANLETGRTHQIRVHLAYIGHPLVGDTVYGRKKQILTQAGQALHAGLLGFIHPVSKVYIEFTAPLPNEFSEIIEKIKQM